MTKYFFRTGNSIEVKRSRWETNLNIDTHALLQKGKWDGKSLKISHRQSWSKLHKKVTRLHHRRHHHHQQHSVADFHKTQFAIFRQNFFGSCYFFLVRVANCYNARIQRREQSFSLIYNTHYLNSCIDDIQYSCIYNLCYSAIHDLYNQTSICNKLNDKDNLIVILDIVRICDGWEVEVV